MAHKVGLTFLVPLLSAFLAGQQAPVDPKLHADAIRLVEVIGTKNAIQAVIKQLVEMGRVAMMSGCKDCDPAFGEEWAKRMLARIDLDEFIAVYVRVYESHFTDDEVLELIAMQNRIRDGRSPTVSDALQKKLSADTTAIQSEIMGATTQIGAKLGGDIGMEIQKEHPEYIRNSKPAPKPQQ